MVAAVITRSGQILYSALNHVAEQEAGDIEDQGSALGADYEAQLSEPTPSAGMPVVGISADHLGWIERLGSNYIGFTDPFAHPVNIDPDAVTVAAWYKDAHIARIETPWQDMSDGGRHKEFFELLLTFQRDTRLYLGVYAETQPRGIRRLYWKGLVFDPQLPVRVPLRLAGTHIRLRLVMVVFNQGRAMLKDMRIGWNPGGTS